MYAVKSLHLIPAKWFSLEAISLKSDSVSFQRSKDSPLFHWVLLNLEHACNASWGSSTPGLQGDSFFLALDYIHTYTYTYIIIYTHTIIYLMPIEGCLKHLQMLNE
jgi:hypothetical protein